MQEKNKKVILNLDCFLKLLFKDEINRDSNAPPELVEPCIIPIIKKVIFLSKV